MQESVALVEDAVVVISAPTGATAYDFDFELHFKCTHPYAFARRFPAILRVGAVKDYASRYAELVSWGLAPVNDSHQHELASELECWYPVVEEMTPRTRIYDSLPSVSEVESEFDWPIFLKGSRQTSRHNPDLSIIRSASHYERIVPLYLADPILGWQRPAIRQFLDLLPVGGDVAGKVKPSMEFRTFWWYGRCVGHGCYWYQVAPYSAPDIEVGLALAAIAASRLDVPFLVVDIAKLRDGSWTIIECNDAQESGHSGIAPNMLWQSVVASVVADSVD